jgi:hypothetical protein
MRGFLAPAVRLIVSDQQKAFQGLSRHRRSKLARAAHTTLVKADQWGRGELAPGEISTALEGALAAGTKKKKG